MESIEKQVIKATRPAEKLKLERRLALVHYNIKGAFNNKIAKFENSAINKIKENPRLFFSYAKAYKKLSSKATISKGDDGKLTSELKDICYIFQKLFSSVYSDPNCEHKRHASINVNNDPLFKIFGQAEISCFFDTIKFGPQYTFPQRNLSFSLYKPPDSNLSRAFYSDLLSLVTCLTLRFQL